MLRVDGPGQRRIPVEQRARVERREQPLVRVDHQRVDPFDAGELGPGTGCAESGAAVRGVDVEPHAALRGDVGEPGQVVDDAGVRGPGRRGDRADRIRIGIRRQHVASARRR